MVMRGKVLAFRGFIYRRGELADAGIVDEESIINNCTTPGDSRATMMSEWVCRRHSLPSIILIRHIYIHEGRKDNPRKPVLHLSSITAVGIITI